MEGPMQRTLDEVLELISKWTPQELVELPLYGNTIKQANKEDNMEAVELISLAL